MTGADLAELAALLRERNVIDERIGRLISRSMTAGHAGEWIASRVFDIELEPSAVAKAIDGRFRSGPLAGKSVNVKWYLKREGLLDMTEATELDYYLVLALRSSRQSTMNKSSAPTAPSSSCSTKSAFLQLFDRWLALQESPRCRVVPSAALSGDA